MSLLLRCYCYLLTRAGIKTGFSCRFGRAALSAVPGGGLALSKAVKMGKKSRRQRDKGFSHSEGNKVINPNSVPPFMRGTIRKNNCVRAFFDNVKNGRVYSMTAGPFATMTESHKVRPGVLRALGTERAYSLTENEFEINQRTWLLRNAFLERFPDDESALDEYLCAVMGNQFLKMGFAPSWKDQPFCESLKYLVLGGRALGQPALARWGRVRPHWRRFRRRLCHFCANSAHLSEPRYLVCSGCGVARYCSEACQAADWRNHEQECYKHQLAQVDDEIEREWERQGV